MSVCSGVTQSNTYRTFPKSFLERPATETPDQKKVIKGYLTKSCDLGETSGLSSMHVLWVKGRRHASVKETVI